MGTFLKKQVMGSQDLTAAEKAFVPIGTSIPITAWAPDGVTVQKEVYDHAPHFRLEGLKKDALIGLAVKYRRQTDNEAYSIFDRGWRQCNLTSNTMMADFLLDGDTTDHEAQTRALHQLGISSYFSRTLSAEDLLNSLRKGIPVVVGHDPYGTMQQVFWDMGREAGWGRIVTSVKGKPTGLATGR